jgi:Ca2+-binding EF-hand superfamily protein
MVNNNPRFNNAFTTAKQFFVNKDTNKDAALTTTEVFGTTPTAENRNLMNYMDFDGNGSLSLAEFTLAIQSVDDNGNGQLESLELTNLTGKATALAVNGKANDFNYQLQAMQLESTQALIQQQTPIIPVTTAIAPTLTASDKAALDAALLVSRSDFRTKDTNRDQLLTLTEAFGATPTAEQQRLYNAINVDKTQGVDLAEMTYANALAKALGTEAAIAKLTGSDAAANLATVRSYVGSVAPTPLPAPVLPPVLPPTPARQLAETAYASATEAFRTKDTNADKFLTSAEAFGAQATVEQQRLFTALDANKDGKLSKTDLVFGELLVAEFGLPNTLNTLSREIEPESPVAEALLARRAAAESIVAFKEGTTPPQTPTPNVRDVFATPAIKAAFDEAVVGAKATFATKDINKDNKLTLTEAMGVNPNAADTEIFNAIDVDNDNVVDLTELSFAVALTKERGLTGGLNVLRNPQNSELVQNKVAQLRAYLGTTVGTTPNVTTPALSASDKAALDKALIIAVEDIRTKDTSKDNILTLTEAFGATPTAAQQRLYNAINVDKTQGVNIAELTFATALATALGTEGAINVLTNPVASERLAQVRAYLATVS